MKDKLIHPISRASFSLLEWDSPCIASSLCSRRSPKSSIFFFSGQTGFFEYEHTFIDNPRVTTEPAVPSARLLGLGSKLYPSNMLRMLNKNLNCFVQCLSSARQNRASERQVLLAENYSLSTGVFLSLFFSFESKQEKSGAHNSTRRSVKRNIESMNKREKLPYYHIFWIPF